MGKLIKLLIVVCFKTVHDLMLFHILYSQRRVDLPAVLDFFRTYAWNDRNLPFVWLLPLL
jgi:hypothetical protein